MDPARLDELVHHAAGALDDPALRDRVALALLIAYKVGRWEMREQAARASVVKRRFAAHHRVMRVPV